MSRDEIAECMQTSSMSSVSAGTPSGHTRRSWCTFEEKSVSHVFTRMDGVHNPCVRQRLRVAMHIFAGVGRIPA